MPVLVYVVMSLLAVGDDSDWHSCHSQRWNTDMRKCSAFS